MAGIRAGAGRAGKGKTLEMERQAALVLTGTQHSLDANDSDLSGSTFTNARLVGAHFSNVNLARITVDNADLSDSRMFDCNMTGVRITNANCENVALADCRITGMTIDGMDVNQLLSAWHAANG